MASPEEEKAWAQQLEKLLAHIESAKESRGRKSHRQAVLYPSLLREKSPSKAASLNPVPLPVENLPRHKGPCAGLQLCPTKSTTSAPAEEPAEEPTFSFSQLCLEEEALDMQVSPWLASELDFADFTQIERGGGAVPSWSQLSGGTQEARLEAQLLLGQLGVGTPGPGMHTPSCIVEPEPGVDAGAPVGLPSAGPVGLPSNPAIYPPASLVPSQHSAQLAVGCPPHLCSCLRTFPSQAEAFAFADAQNASQPFLVTLAPRVAAGDKLVAEAVLELPQLFPVPDAAPKPALMPVRAALASMKENVPRKSPVPRVPAAAWGPDAAGSHQRFREALRTLKTAAEGAASQACEAGQSQSSGESPPAKADARPGADGEPEPEAVAPVPLRQPAVHVFCVERSGRGGAFYRSFAAASYPAVWQQYHQTPALQRHWYEVIREGHPCHLYFDLEFPIELNPGVDGQALTQRLLVLVQKCLWNKFQLRMDARQHVVLLDSTSATKFSSHLVVKLPGHAFQDNAAAGRFVRSVLLASGTELTVVQGLDARTGQPVRSPFVDTAVYTRNRHFRMAGSCKGGKTAVLQTLHGQGVPPETAFMQALVGHVRGPVSLLQVSDPCALHDASGGPGRAVSRTGQVLSVPGAPPRVCWKQEGRDDSLPAAFVEELKVLAKEAIPFMERMATARAGQLTTRVRTLAFCGQQGHVAYGLAGPGCHYCENIGRCHTSNHAFYVVNFVSGHFAQKCYDPDCSGYRSAWMPLPPGLCCSNGGEPRGARVSEA
ncbi:hypothetical protein ACKKBF_B13675 [Auxenochlorella protothecoides x Auxenochlorella symbiontica]